MGVAMGVVRCLDTSPRSQLPSNSYKSVIQKKDPTKITGIKRCFIYDNLFCDQKMAKDRAMYKKVNAR